MKKLYTIFLLVCFALGVYAETEFTFTSSADLNQEKDGITVVLGKGSNTQAPTVGTDYETGMVEMRMYTNNTITVSSEDALTNIQLVFAKRGAKAYAGLSANPGTLTPGGESTSITDWKVDSWAGSATQVVFTITGSGQRNLRSIVIDGDPVVIVPEEEAPLPTEDDLDWTYEYQEPEIVHTPDTNIFHKEYAFIDGNILVHCDSGSINKAQNEKPAAFSCIQNRSITFTATQYIKGIAVKGTLKKNHETSTSRGDISYYIDENEEPTGDPVLVVRNINAMSVTLTCTKNISFEEVKVYFEENPDPVGTEIDVPGETFFLEYDTASVEYDPDESESGKHVYSLYIWDKTNEYIYLTLDINVPEQNKFVGTYAIESGNMTEESFFQYGEEYEDYSYATEGQMVIRKENGAYIISGYITCENKNTYNFSYTGIIEGGLDEDVPEGINEINSEIKAQKVLQNGQLYIIKNGRVYTAEGTAVK